MLDEVELRRMSPIERARLARTLASLDNPRPVDDPRFRLGRRMWLTITVGACFVLAAWIGVLAVTLPRDFTAGGWRVSWVGFDVALLAVFAVTAWAAWRCRQLLIACLIVTATLLLCDAWFDLTLDWGTSAFVWSVVSAVFAEVPVAILMIIAARRALRLTIRAVLAREGYAGPVPSLWRLALFSPGPGNGTLAGNAGNTAARPAHIAVHDRAPGAYERAVDRRSA